MYWLWVNLGIILVFYVIWLWKGQKLFAHNILKKVLGHIISVVILADGISTIIGQPPAYWYSYSRYNEASIIGKLLLGWHPLAFTLGIIFWIILIFFLIKKIPLFSPCIIFFALFLGHSLGAWSWINGWLLDGIDNITGGKIQGLWLQIYKEFIEYLFYIFLGFIFSFILKKVYHGKT